jgi:Fe-S-cluster-containing hydrogenase component 2
MNHFIISDSRKCIGCKACEVACVMAHNDEQHVLTPQRFLPRITVMKHEQKRNAITCRHCESAPCARSCPNDALFLVNLHAIIYLANGIIRAAAGTGGAFTMPTCYCATFLLVLHHGNAR